MNGTDDAYATTASRPEWRRGYEQAAVEQFLAAAETERLRLQVLIEEALGRGEEVNRQHAADVEAAQEELGALTMEARAEVERLEAAHEQAVEILRAEAQATADAILEAARSIMFGAPDEGAGAEVIDLRRRIDEISVAKVRAELVAEAEGEPSS